MKSKAIKKIVRENENNKPTLEQWDTLYQAAVELRNIKPWSFLWDSYIVVIQLPGHSEPFYCSVMGAGGECYGIAIYLGEEGLQSYYRLSDVTFDQEELSVFEGFYQKCLLVNFGSRDEVDAEDKKIIKALNLKFRGSHQWPFFRAMDPGYFPWYMNADQVTLCTEILKHLTMAVTAYANGHVSVNFEGGEFLLHSYPSKKAGWENKAIPEVFPTIHKVIIEDQLLVERMKRKKTTGAQLEFDMTYLPEPIQENPDERPYLPQILLLVDHGNGVALDQEMLDPTVEIEKEVTDFLVRNIEKNGRPSTIYIRSEYVGQYVEDLCQKLKIKLIDEYGVPIIDEFLLGALDFFE